MARSQNDCLWRICDLSRKSLLHSCKDSFTLKAQKRPLLGCLKMANVLCTLAQTRGRIRESLATTSYYDEIIPCGTHPITKRGLGEKIVSCIILADVAIQHHQERSVQTFRAVRTRGSFDCFVIAIILVHSVRLPCGSIFCSHLYTIL